MGLRACILSLSFRTQYFWAIFRTQGSGSASDGCSWATAPALRFQSLNPVRFLLLLTLLLAREVFSKVQNHPATLIRDFYGGLSVVDARDAPSILRSSSACESCGPVISTLEGTDGSLCLVGIWILYRYEEIGKGSVLFAHGEGPREDLRNFTDEAYSTSVGTGRPPVAKQKGVS